MRIPKTRNIPSFSDPEVNPWYPSSSLLSELDSEIRRLELDNDIIQLGLDNDIYRPGLDTTRRFSGLKTRMRTRDLPGLDIYGPKRISLY